MENVTYRRESTVALLKAIAYSTMFIDHLASVIVEPLLGSLGYDTNENPIIELMNLIGRIAFPLFCFLLIEGVKKSKNRLKYLTRLLLMAIISEPCFDLAHSGKLWDPSYQNVCVLLFIAACMLTVEEICKAKIGSIYLRLAVFVPTAVLATYLSYLLKTDYSISGIIIVIVIELIMPLVDMDIFYAMLAMGGGVYAAYFIKYFVMYPTHRSEGIDWIWYFKSAWTLQMFEPVALFFVNGYSGKKGKTLNKVFYYSFYPVHLLVLGLIAYFIF